MRNLDPPAIVRSAEDDLAALAVQIKAEHEAGDRAAAKGLEHYRKAGEMLIKAKELCVRQQRPWLEWLKREVGISRSTASNHRHIAERWGSLCSVARHEGLTEALKFLKFLEEQEQEEEQEEPEDEAAHEADDAIPESAAEASAEEQTAQTDAAEAAADVLSFPVWETEQAQMQAEYETEVNEERFENEARTLGLAVWELEHHAQRENLIADLAPELCEALANVLDALADWAPQMRRMAVALRPQLRDGEATQTEGGSACVRRSEGR